MTHNRTRRRKFTTLQRAEFFRTHGGICHICKLKIDGSKEEWEIEHVIPRELFADPADADNDENLRPAHKKGCHSEKTKQDKAKISKSNRQYAKFTANAHRPSGKLRGAGFKQTRAKWSNAQGLWIDKETGEPLDPQPEPR